MKSLRPFPLPAGGQRLMVSMMNPRLPTARLICTAAALAVACGGEVDGDGAGGAGSSGGDTGAGGTVTGGASTGGVGAGGVGAADTGGASTDGGAGSGGGGGGGSGGEVAAGGTAGATNGSENCPPAPIERLFPIIGPFWIGPHPGPCAAEPEGTIYTYDNGLVNGSTLNGGETYVRDEMGRMTASVSDLDPATFEYDASTVTETRDQHQVVYALSNNGYPLTATVTDAASSAPRTYTYHYVNCRPFMREAPGNLDDRTYEYDEEGHLVSLVDGATTVTFDYGCW